MLAAMCVVVIIGRAALWRLRVSGEPAAYKQLKSRNGCFITRKTILRNSCEMGQVLSGIWQNAPVWVWPLFFVLLTIGLLARRDRSSSIIPYFFYPLFGLSAANAIQGLTHVPTNWITFAAAYVIGMAIAFRWQDSLILQKSGWTMQLRGDKGTLVILMTIFFSNFIGGVLQAVAPQVLDAMAYTLVFAAIIGACSGSFTGRALRVISCRVRPA